MEEARKRDRMEEVRLVATLHETPVFMRVFRTRRWLQCDFGRGKVNGKRPISTIFLGFSAIFAQFRLF
jgi:hypothetical protein